MQIFKIIIGSVLISWCFTNTQCDNKDVNLNNDLSNDIVCTESVLVDDEIFNEGVSEAFVIESASIEEGCITIVVSASGCNSNNWEFDLIASTLIGESILLQRFVKLKFNNPEDCLAYFTKEVSFNLEVIQIAAENKIGIILSENEDVLLYTY